MPEFHEVECTGCGLYLDPSLFANNKASKNGLAVWCKYCMAAYRAAHREQNIAYQREYRQKNPQRLRENSKRKYITSGRNWGLQKRYGITEEVYDQMLANQVGCCAICRSHDPGKRRAFFCVDHSHATGQVRGLLCAECNTAIGKFKDDPTILREASLYLERGGFR